jgi:hypothetical protein
MVEAMVALTLIDHLLLNQAQCHTFPDTATDQANPMGTTAQGKGVSKGYYKSPPNEPERVSLPMDNFNSAPVSQRVDEE